MHMAPAVAPGVTPNAALQLSVPVGETRGLFVPDAQICRAYAMPEP
jgi:hypothetical protein